MFVPQLLSFFAGVITGVVFGATAGLGHNGSLGWIIGGFIVRWCMLLLLLTVLYRTLSLDLVIVLAGFFLALWIMIFKRLRGFS
ncbi:MAG: hypothetical protein WCT20_01035 [Candidatus Babeliales bacterium]